MIDIITAVGVCRFIENAISPKMHAALTGSTLVYGYGEDMDVVVFPHDSSAMTAADQEAHVIDALRNAGMVLMHSFNAFDKHRSRRSTDRKRIAIFVYGSIKVDIFSLR